MNKYVIAKWFASHPSHEILMFLLKGDDDYWGHRGEIRETVSLEKQLGNFRITR